VAAIEAQRDFRLAETNLFTALVTGGPAGDATASTSMAAAPGAPAGH
jgi:hypothetical protein